MFDATWYDSLVLPTFTPPSYLFGIVWPILYAMMLVAAAIIIRHGWQTSSVRVALLVFIIQLALNLSWSPIFFGLHNIGLAAIVIVVLWVAIVANLLLFWRLSRLAGILLVPYLLWVSFALVLNFTIWHLN
jgi:translocator protein